MSRSRSVELQGSQVPQYEVTPGVEPGGLAADAIEFCRAVGFDLDPWQERVLAASLAEDGDRWAATTVGVVVPRQNGKGTLLEARELVGLFLLGERLILHSAHEFKTSYEHFLRVVQAIEGCHDLDRQVLRVRRGAGEQAVELRSGERLRFIARSSGSGRGMSAPLVVLDEAMFLSEAQLGSIVPTLSAQTNPQLWVTSSAPMASSEALHRLRSSALDGAPRTLWCEWGNGPDVDPADPAAIAAANPALGRRLALSFVDTERAAMAPDEFARERLGVPEAAVSSAGPIDPDVWLSLVDGQSMVAEGTRVVLGFDAPPDRRSATFAVAGYRPDGLVHVDVRLHVPQVDRSDDRSLTERVVAAAVALCEGHGVPLVAPPSSPALAWAPELRAAGVVLDVLPGGEWPQACGLMRAAVDDGRLRHRGLPVMAGAVGGLAARVSGDTEVWSRRSSRVDISPFCAATAALWRCPVAPEPVTEAWVMFR